MDSFGEDIVSFLLKMRRLFFFYLVSVSVFRAVADRCCYHTTQAADEDEQEQYVVSLVISI